MSSKTTVVTDEINEYLQDKFGAPEEILDAINKIASVKGMPTIHISKHQAKYMQFMLKSINAKYVLEIGSLAGYSAIAMASALPEGGKLIAVELNPDYADLIRKNAEKAGVADKIEVVCQDARQFVENFKAEHPLDFIFIDADKQSYYHYLTALTPHLRSGGIFAADNAFAFGFLLEASPERDPEEIKSVKSFNEAFASSDEYFVTLAPVGDGLIMGLKK